MLLIGKKKDICRITRQFSADNYFDEFLSEKLRAYVLEQHRIGNTDFYSLNFVDVTCKVFLERWTAGV